MVSDTDVMIDRRGMCVIDEVFLKINAAIEEDKTHTVYTFEDDIYYGLTGSALRESEIFVITFLNSDGYTIEEKLLEDGITRILEIDWSEPKPSQFDGVGGLDGPSIYPTANDIYSISMKNKGK